MLQSGEGVYFWAFDAALLLCRKDSADPLMQVSINACQGANTSADHWKEQI